MIRRNGAQSVLTALVAVGQLWTAKSVWLRTDSDMYEYACHEANYSIVNILRGARASERSPQ